MFVIREVQRKGVGAACQIDTPPQLLSIGDEKAGGWLGRREGGRRGQGGGGGGSEAEGAGMRAVR